MRKVKLGLLDFGYRENKIRPRSLIKEIVDYAIAADRLGYSQFWLGEHHSGSRAWSNPEMLLPVIAAVTDRISVGIAGILLAAHSPYRVALNFKLLSNLFPGRIDLGLANGKIEDQYVSLLAGSDGFCGSVKALFPIKVRELLRYFYEEEDLLKESKMVIPPFKGSLPAVWRLSSSFRNLKESIEQKTFYSRSLLHGLNDDTFQKDAVVEYKKDYFHLHGMNPRVNIAFAGMCSENDRGVQLQCNDSGKIEAFIIGSPSQFNERIFELIERFQVDEFVFYDLSSDARQRLRAIELLAKQFF